MESIYVLILCCYVFEYVLLFLYQKKIVIKVLFLGENSIYTSIVNKTHRKITFYMNCRANVVTRKH